MNMQDKIEGWNKQLEQAKEYQIFFDWQTVKEIIETIEEQQKLIDRLEAEIRIMDYFSITK